MCRVLFTAVMFAVLSAVSALTGPQQAAAAPFTCDNSFYQIINGGLTRLNPDTGAYVAIGGTGSMITNAAGYNIEDDYIYAWQRVDPFSAGSTGLVRIEDDATTTPLGIPTGMTDGNFIAGDFDMSGNLYALNGSTPSALWSIDVSSVTGSSIALSAPLTGANDLVFVNGLLYSTNGTSLYRIDPGTGTVTTLSLGLASGVYGAGWASDNSKLFFSRNSDGMIFEITNFTSPSPGATPVLEGDTATGNDGASCVTGRSPIPPFFATDDTNSTTVDTAVSGNVLPNDSGRDITVTSYTQPPNGTVVVNPDGSYTYTPNNGFTGTDTFTYTITDEYGETRIATVTITVSPVPSAVVQLANTGASVYLLLTGALALIAGAAGAVHRSMPRQ